MCPRTQHAPHPSHDDPGRVGLVYTVPFVLYGFFRYLYLVHQKDGGGNPTRTLLSDPPLLIDALLWIVTTVTILNWR